MAIVLGGIALPDDLIFSELFSDTGITGETEISDDGTPIVYEGDSWGADRSLMGGADSGWIMFSVLKSIKALAAVRGAEYALVKGSDTFNVRFAHEAPPVISADPVGDYAEPEDSDFFCNLSIKLREV